MENTLRWVRNSKYQLKMRSSYCLFLHCNVFEAESFASTYSETVKHFNRAVTMNGDDLIDCN